MPRRLQVGKDEYTSQLEGMCQTLVAEHESDIVNFFFKNAAKESRQNIWAKGQKEICTRSDPGLVHVHVLRKPFASFAFRLRTVHNYVWRADSPPDVTS